MAILRRQLLKFTGAALLLAAVPGLSIAAGAASGRQLRAYQVRDDLALPKFRTGNILAVDADCTSFAGAGIYLYPAWGQPRPYFVSAEVNGLLHFSNPGTGQLLWTQSSKIDNAFAGRVTDDRPQLDRSFATRSIAILSRDT